MRNRYWIIAAVVLLLMAVGIGTYLLYHKVTANSIALTADDRIDVTPQQIRAIRDIGQWEFLSVSDEQMVDTVRRGIFFDGQLVRIYYGTLRLGIDMQQLSDSAFTSRHDTLCVTLPPVKLLDDRFIDEARTRSFISEGTWDSSVREALYHKARRQMIDQCMTTANIRKARENAVEQVRSMLRSMGFEHVTVNFEKDV